MCRNSIHIYLYCFHYGRYVDGPDLWLVLWGRDLADYVTQYHQSSLLQQTVAMVEMKMSKNQSYFWSGCVYLKDTIDFQIWCLSIQCTCKCCKTSHVDYTVFMYFFGYYHGMSDYVILPIVNYIIRCTLYFNNKSKIGTKPKEIIYK